jgi:muramoyltetrapeptide carboxypeptidase
MNIPTIQPPKLKMGDTLSIVAPASTVESRDGFEQGAAALERMGFRVRFDERIFHPTRYLAGNDASRAEELMRSFEDPSIQAIIALRGGYGCARLMPLLSKKRLRRHPKIFMGFSDITALHLFFNRHFGWITIHGPMANSSALGDFPVDQESHLLSLWTDPEYRPTLNFPELDAWFPGTAEGNLTGGCLSIVTTSLGTPYEIRTEGKILFLEDQGEPPYRLDRMLTHLRLSGKLQNVAGFLLGQFPDCEPTKGDYSSKDVLRDLLTELRVPIIANFPAGHGESNWAIPLGAKIRIDADARTISFLGPAVR